MDVTDRDGIAWIAPERACVCVDVLRALFPSRTTESRIRGLREGTPRDYRPGLAGKNFDATWDNGRRFLLEFAPDAKKQRYTGVVGKSNNETVDIETVALAAMTSQAYWTWAILEEQLHEEEMLPHPAALSDALIGPISRCCPPQSGCSCHASPRPPRSPRRMAFRARRGGPPSSALKAPMPTASPRGCHGFAIRDSRIANPWHPPSWSAGFQPAVRRPLARRVRGAAAWKAADP
ncbi:hypothetical protein LZC95_22040 [Pendulispora brunnea]|uniref:Uncharacterized protein n=1 Tax=Pendulispora brunnea TaxID=2905690 RepID=A0ABZ2KP92_9BACT